MKLSLRARERRNFRLIDLVMSNTLTQSEAARRYKMTRQRVNFMVLRHKQRQKAKTN